jgi:hypothetical protein
MSLRIFKGLAEGQYCCEVDPNQGALQLGLRHILVLEFDRLRVYDLAQGKSCTGRPSVIFEGLLCYRQSLAVILMGYSQDTRNWGSTGQASIYDPVNVKGKLGRQRGEMEANRAKRPHYYLD